MIITRSPYPDISLTDETITQRVIAGLAARRDQTVLVDGPTRQGLTAGQVIDGIRQLAGGLAARGQGAGKVTALMAPNCPDYAIAFHGPLWAGGTVTTINPSYTAPEVAHQLRDSDATLLITVPAFLDTARRAAEGTGVTEIAVIGEAEGGQEGATPLGALMGPPLMSQTPVDVTRHIAVLPYSSGTTGLPKGVMLTHRNLVVNVDQTQAALQVGPGDWSVAFLPFFHIYGQTVLLNLFLASGGSLVTLPRFDLEMFLRLVAEYRTERVFCVPPVAVALAKHPMVGQHDLSAVRLVFSGAAPLSDSLSAAVAERLGCEVAQGYGMTEMAPVSHITPRGGARFGAAGLTAPNTECRIVDPATWLDADEGELWVRGPQVMAGYLNNPEATARTLTPEGWLKTGDLGGFDADGYLFIRDRVKELIKVKGFQVAPAEVEAALLTHPGVADAAVRGWPDDEAGEVPVAYVVAQKGVALDDAGLAAHLAGRLASYKVPQRYALMEAIPKSPSGKILRRLLPDVR
jgi:4-coumarate--CoA ligase